MGKSSFRKGSAGEREFVAFCKSIGWEARRFGHIQRPERGASEFPDVEVKELPEFHFEVKRVEKIKIWDSLIQAAADAFNSKKTPVVAFRRNRSPWYVSIPARDFFQIMEQLRQSESD